MASVINNGIPMVNGMLVSWADIVVLIGGVPVTGITGVVQSGIFSIVLILINKTKILLIVVFHVNLG